MRTRRTAVFVIAMSTFVMGLAAPAHAAKPSPRPVVSVGELTGPTEGPEGGQEWWLPIDATDPDGVIWEVMVRWSDGEIAIASTGCLQGMEPGTPAHLLIPHQFASPGRYIVRVQVSSLQACPFVAPPGTEQESHPVVKVISFHG
jgi:hypothetical protein